MSTLARIQAEAPLPNQCHRGYDQYDHRDNRDYEQQFYRGNVVSPFSQRIVRPSTMHIARPAALSIHRAMNSMAAHAETNLSQCVPAALAKLIAIVPKYDAISIEFSSGSGKTSSQHPNSVPLGTTASQKLPGKIGRSFPLQQGYNPEGTKCENSFPTSVPHCIAGVAAVGSPNTAAQQHGSNARRWNRRRLHIDGRPLHPRDAFIKSRGTRGAGTARATCSPGLRGVAVPPASCRLCFNR